MLTVQSFTTHIKPITETNTCLQWLPLSFPILTLTTGVCLLDDKTNHTLSKKRNMSHACTGITRLLTKNSSIYNRTYLIAIQILENIKWPQIFSLRLAVLMQWWEMKMMTITEKRNTAIPTWRFRTRCPWRPQLLCTQQDISGNSSSMLHH